MAGYNLFPQSMTKSQPVLEDLTRQALRNHQGLRGVPADHAQLLYISEAAQAESYAEEYFPGRVKVFSEFIFIHLINFFIHRFQVFRSDYHFLSQFFGQKMRKIFC